MAGLNKKSRPLNRKALMLHLASITQKRTTDAEVLRITDAFFEKNFISESDHALTDHF